MSAASALQSPASMLRRISHADGSRPRILYAEDQPTSRVVTTALLERLGLEVHAVEDGEDAVRAAEGQSFDLILLDIEMPVMDGVTAARDIRAMEAHAGTPILALSAFLADSTEQSHWRGAFDFALPKPANGQELDRAIRAALGTAPKRETDPAGNIAVAVSVAEALKVQLPPVFWSRVSALAKIEAQHYINAALCAEGAGNVETVGHCLSGLRSLSVSFGYEALAAALDPEQMAARDLKDIARLVDGWPLGVN